MYTPDARQQWVGWHSRIVGKRGWTGTFLEGGIDVLRREVWCIVRGGSGADFLDGGQGHI